MIGERLDRAVKHGMQPTGLVIERRCGWHLALGGLRPNRGQKLFSSQNQAKAFLVERILVQAQAEGQPLSDNEKWMLSYSESDPDFVADPVRVEQVEAEIAGSDYEMKIAHLLRRAYQRDLETDRGARALYREASATLRQGDHFLLLIIDQALGKGTGVGLASLFWRALRIIVIVGSIALAFQIGLGRYLGREPSGEEWAFYAWLVAIAFTGVYLSVRFAVGAHAFDHAFDAILDALLGDRRR